MQVDELCAVGEYGTISAKEFADSSDMSRKKIVKLAAYGIPAAVVAWVLWGEALVGTHNPLEDISELG